MPGKTGSGWSSNCWWVFHSVPWAIFDITVMMVEGKLNEGGFDDI